MRSEQIHRALAQGHNRFEICQLVSKGVRVTHKPGARFEDSIGNVLDHLSPSTRSFDSHKEPQSALVVPAA
jgi:hypothetical protein